MKEIPMKRTAFLLTAASLLVSSSAVAAQGVDGVLSLSPVGTHSCVAIELQLGGGQAIAGLRWYNNDGNLAFPQVLLLESDGQSAPDLTQTALELTDVRGVSLGWSETSLATPVTSSTGVIYAVFVLPADRQRTADGTDGGPGFGYVQQRSGARTFLSAGGESWVQLKPSLHLAVEPILSNGGGFAMALSSMGSVVALSTESLAKAPVAYRTELLPALPNPFNPSTTFQFSLSEAMEVRLSLYNVRGRKVKVLHRGPLSAGLHQIPWHGIDDRGQSAASGVYLLQMEADGQNFQQRVLLVK
jgi:FlgD Ig-like domain